MSPIARRLRRFAVRCTASLSLSLIAGSAIAQSMARGPAEPKTERIQRAGAPPVIGGVLNEEIWLRAEVYALAGILLRQLEALEQRLPASGA